MAKCGGALAQSATVALCACSLAAACDEPLGGAQTALPVGAPGDILESRPHRFSLDPLGQAADDTVQAWKVLYVSESALGEPIAVSGTVIVPTAPWGGSGARPLVSWAVGTRGLGDACAPSETLASGTDYEGLFFKSALTQGWAVAISDYEGLGTAGVHTYMVGQSQGRVVLDMARAAQRLPEAGLGADAPVGILGYSQGGGAVAWAAELAPIYAPELDIVGIAAGGTPADLAATAELVDGGPFVAFALLASVGLDAAYPELDLRSYLNADGEALFEQAVDVCLVDVAGFTTLLSTAFTSRSDYATEDPLAAPQWQLRLEENRLGSAAPDVPVLLYHSPIDEIVPFEPAVALRQAWCEQGANVTWKELGGEHVIGLVEGAPLALSFLADRFAGVATSGNCSSP